MTKTNSCELQIMAARKKQTVLLWSALATLLLVILTIMSGSVKADQELSLAAADDSLVYMPLIIGSPAPSTSYNDEFTDSIEPWAARRWSAGADYEIKHNAGCDDGHCGFLEMKVNNSQAYVIASPLEAVEAPFTYNIKTRAKLLNREDGDEYGIIFGGDYAGNDCPAVDFSTCFTK